MPDCGTPSTVLPAVSHQSIVPKIHYMVHMPRLMIKCSLFSYLVFFNVELGLEVVEEVCVCVCVCVVGGWGVGGREIECLFVMIMLLGLSLAFTD